MRTQQQEIKAVQTALAILHARERRDYGEHRRLVLGISPFDLLFGMETVARQVLTITAQKEEVTVSHLLATVSDKLELQIMNLEMDAIAALIETEAPANDTEGTTNPHE